jgi:hypothetical protein
MLLAVVLVIQVLHADTVAMLGVLAVRHAAEQHVRRPALVMARGACGFGKI